MDKISNAFKGFRCDECGQQAMKFTDEDEVKV
jgi:hypothetical protein